MTSGMDDRLFQKGISDRLPSGLFGESCKIASISCNSATEQSNAIISIMRWIINNTSDDPNLYDWSDELETEFKLRFL